MSLIAQAGEHRKFFNLAVHIVRSVQTPHPGTITRPGTIMCTSVPVLHLLANLPYLFYYHHLSRLEVLINNRNQQLIEDPSFNCLFAGRFQTQTCCLLQSWLFAAEAGHCQMSLSGVDVHRSPDTK